jgi:hypothetical protein
MKCKRPMTAAELMAKLEADPEFRKRTAEKEEQRAVRRDRLQEVERPILDELRRTGITAGSIEDMTNRYAPLAPEIVRVLLDWLPRVQDDRVREAVVRALAAAREPFDGTPLVNCFLRDTSGTLRWPIANTMAEARPFGIADWLCDAVKNRSYGAARQMLVLALARLATAGSSLLVLLSVLDELPGHVAIALGEVGGVTELRVLQARVGDTHGWEKEEFLKAIRRIESRLRETP